MSQADNIRKILEKAGFGDIAKGDDERAMENIRRMAEHMNTRFRLVGEVTEKAINEIEALSARLAAIERWIEDEKNRQMGEDL